MVAVVVSVDGVPLRLTEERWRHSLEYHRELAGLLDEILVAVAEPDVVFGSPPGIEENCVAIKKFAELSHRGLADHPAVHYREVSDDDGFILTVFPVSTKRIRRRYSLWQRRK